MLDAVPGETFIFRTMPARDPSRHDSTTWSYRLRPSADGAGTEVTHSYEITLMPSRVFKAIYGVWLPQHRDMRPQMLESLQNLKRSLE